MIRAAIKKFHPELCTPRDYDLFRSQVIQAIPIGWALYEQMSNDDPRWIHASVPDVNEFMNGMQAYYNIDQDVAMCVYQLL